MEKPQAQEPGPAGWGWVLAPQLTGWMASGKSLSLSEPWFAHLLNGNNESPLQVVVRTR